MLQRGQRTFSTIFKSESEATIKKQLMDDIDDLTKKRALVS